MAQTASKTIASLTDTYPPSANTTKSRKHFVSTNLHSGGNISALQKILVAAKFDADAELSKELGDMSVFTDLSYTDQNSATVLVTLNERDLTTFVEKVR